MRNYEILEHTADLKIKAFGKTKKELFENALKGMFESAKYEGGDSKLERAIKISSLDSSSLLVDFLSEALYLAEVNQEVYSGIKFKTLSEKEIEGILIGKKKKRMGVQIKGVTYHGLDIHQEEDGTWEATVLFDI